MVMMLTSIDFWIVKNIVGRKLIKMRWWFLIDNQGNERWYYEYKGKKNFEIIPSYCRYHYPLPRQAGLLGTLYATPMVWGLFTVMNALTFAIFKTATTFICMIIALVQLWGFKNCKTAMYKRAKWLREKESKKLRN